MTLGPDWLQSVNEQIEDVNVAPEAEQCRKYNQHASKKTSLRPGVVSSIVGNQRDEKRSQMLECDNREILSSCARGAHVHCLSEGTDPKLGTGNCLDVTVLSFLVPIHSKHGVRLSCLSRLR